MSDEEDNVVWQDREIHFDDEIENLEPRKGEFIIDSIEGIEDTKGNNGERGSLMITNLRMIWTSARSKRVNLSIGYNSITNISIKAANSRLRGTTHALYVLTKQQASRFEFVFTNMVKSSPRLFTTVQTVFRAYDTTKTYRDLRLRGATVKDQQLIVLPKEKVYNKVPGVWNLSSDQGNLGSLYVTNVRVVWFADMAENFNVSIPYLQMSSIRVRESKFGPALVVETSPASGAYVLGFRIDPKEKLQELFKEMSSMHATFSNNPIFGVEYTVQEQPKALEQLKVPMKEEDITIVDDDAHDAFSAYYAEMNKSADREVVFSSSLGLAVEKPPEGFTTAQLWAVVPE